MSDVQVQLQERKTTLQSEFDAVGVELTKLNEEGKKLNQKMSALRQRQVQIQGAYAEVEKLLGAVPEVEAPKRVPVKK